MLLCRPYISFWRVNLMPLELRDAFGSLEGKSNIGHFGDAHGALTYLSGCAGRFWSKGSSEHSRWVSACTDVQDFLNTILTSKNKGEKIEDVLRKIIHKWQHSAGRISDLLESSSTKLSVEKMAEERQSTFEWLDLIRIAAIYGTLNTWLPLKQESTIVRIDIKIDIDSSTTSESTSIEHRPMLTPRRFRRRFM